MDRDTAQILRTLADSLEAVTTALRALGEASETARDSPDGFKRAECAAIRTRSDATTFKNFDRWPCILPGGHQGDHRDAVEDLWTGDKDTAE